MKPLNSYEKALIYIEKNSQEDVLAIQRKQNPGPTITISRETGIGAYLICEKLADYFNSRAVKFYDDWTFFDKELINKIVDDHNLPSHFKKFLAEETSAKLDSWFGEILGITPSKLTLLNKTKKTILKLAEFGNVIIVGRGANIILANKPNTFHIRLVAPLNYRIETASKFYDMDKKTASEFINQEDEARKEYLLKYFHKKVNNPLLYHTIINTHLINFDEIAELIGQCVIRKFPKYFSLK